MFFNTTMTRLMRITVIVLSLILDPVNSQCSWSEIGLTTFNTGLIPQVPLYNDRVTRVSKALAAHDTDILCLQEVNYESDYVNILETVQDKYRYSYSFFQDTICTKEALDQAKNNRDGFKPFPCADPNFPPYAACVKNCNFTGREQSKCSIGLCTAELFNLSPDCLTCLGNTGADQAQLADKCLTPGLYKRISGEGILLLSKYKLWFPRKITLSRDVLQIFPRGIVDAYVFGLGWVSCTHLTADLTPLGFPYFEFQLFQEKGIASFSQQQSNEIQYLEDLYRFNPFVALAGDLNVGPSIPANGVSAASPMNYDNLINQGYRNPYVRDVGLCTFCAANPISPNFTTILDHILLSRIRVSSAQRVFVEDSAPLSDHYGVSACLETPWSWIG